MNIEAAVAFRQTLEIDKADCQQRQHKASRLHELLVLLLVPQIFWARGCLKTKH
jgi:hypothetical protein